MDEKSAAPPDIVSQIRELLGLGADASGTLGALERTTRRQLLEYAERLGLTDLSSLTKEGIAARFDQALRALGVSLGVVAAPEPAAPADLPRKFDLGLPTEKARVPEHIPWGYGQDRVTAMVVDPDRLYVYWEATDEALTRARAQLGTGGRDAWLNLRVYDVTQRLFDGTNAHGYFDHKVERGDRQWFFHVGKPSSTACVELGLRSSEGYFVRIARSGRADFPRREPAPAAEVEWLTVQVGSEESEAAPAEPPPPAAPGGEDTAGHRSPHAPGGEADGRVSVARPRGARRAAPRQIVIRRFGARSERRILARWVVSAASPADAGRGLSAPDAALDTRALGASERRLGASEIVHGGASDWRYGGASEVQLGGASEERLGGASDARLGGDTDAPTAYPGPFAAAGEKPEPPPPR